MSSPDFETFATCLWESLVEGYKRPLSLPFVYDGSTDEDTWGEDRLHLSDGKYALLGEMCPRELALRLSGAEGSKPSLSTLRMWEQGYLCEDVWIERSRYGMEQRGWEVVIPERDSVEFEGIPGTPDVIYHRPPVKVVVDTKTRRSGWYKFQAAEHGRPDQGDGFILGWPPKPAEEIQVQEYIEATDATFGAIWAGDRGGSRRWVLPHVKRDPEAARKAIKLIRRIEELTREGKIEKIPKVPLTPKGNLPWNCKWCSYYGSSCGGAE